MQEQEGVQKKEVYLTNTLQYYASLYLEKPVDDRVLKSIDMTRILYQELIRMVKTGEFINININGWQTSGKSTVMMALGDFITENALKLTECRYCKEKGRTHIYKDFGIRNIARDEQEYSVKMRDKNNCHMVLGTDEMNELEHGGVNATVEAALRNQFSQVQAQRYVHRITCSPTDAPDKTANILLEVIQPDKTRKKTHCQLFYKLIRGGILEVQLLGHVNIDVSRVMRKGWYKEYREKKMEKWDLIMDHGIFRPRMVEYAGIVKSTITQLKPLAIRGIIRNTDIIANFIQKEAMEAKVPLTILGLKELVSDANGVLSMYRSLESLNRQEGVMKKKFEKNETDHSTYTFECGAIEETRNSILAAINMQMEQYDKMIEINKKYNYAGRGEGKDGNQSNESKGNKEQQNTNLA